MKVFGIKRKAEPTLLVTGEQAVEKGFTVQITDQMFNDWVRQHQRLLFGIAYWWTGSRTDAEELTQEAFLQAYRSRSSLRDVELVKGWLVGILRHCHSQMLRRTKSRKEVSFDEMLYEPESQTTLSADALALQVRLAVCELDAVALAEERDELGRIDPLRCLDRRHDGGRVVVG